MSMTLGDALLSRNFGFQIDGIQVEAVHEISGFQQEQDTITYMQNTADGIPVTKNMPGAEKGGTCQIVFGITKEKIIQEWIKASQEGLMGEARKNASIVFNDWENGETLRINLENAWCGTATPSAVSAGSTDPLTMTATISYERLSWE
ncbi:phage tail protein [Streptomyces sp. JH002]|jgi:phage tail-like protein|uniref:Phage tail protein n=1 Tax=Streptomyces xiamenensis TaxID=408015 RepID=A0A0F7FUN9_9ACTN|nr:MULTISPECIES: phage tail protein [Streptomyces]AKG43519.1 phage tail protein [Streptomyces xiamenensis]MCU4748368.1 phage tail protein [Streptomyces sp. G-5]QQN78923.1 phage tail protein [Streptomyces sp. XC 2026]